MFVYPKEREYLWAAVSIRQTIIDQQELYAHLPITRSKLPFEMDDEAFPKLPSSVNTPTADCRRPISSHVDEDHDEENSGLKPRWLLPEFR
jgi:hypothetical protein